MNILLFTSKKHTLLPPRTKETPGPEILKEKISETYPVPETQLAASQLLEEEDLSRVAHPCAP